MREVNTMIIGLLTLIIVIINIQLHSENYTREEKKEDILLQLNFLERELKKNNLGDRMQSIFPEGYVFVYALYGLSWCEIALANPNDIVVKNRALNEALYAFDNLKSQTATSTFPSHLNPKYGIFYNGWRNYLLSKIMLLDTTFDGHAMYTNTFKIQSDIIANALAQSSSPYLESYQSQSWPADMFIAMASLSNYDKVFQTKYHAVIDKWLDDIKSRLDPVTGMLPHKVNSRNGKNLHGARGCSMGLMLRVLGEIHPAFAKEQFQLFEKNFVSTTFGLPSVREYPVGQSGLGDIDSGPVIFGVGFSATIVTIGTLAMYDKIDLANKLYRTIHAFGFRMKGATEKKYLFGALPMADAFIAWGRSTELYYSDNTPVESGINWALKFHGISILIIGCLWLVFYRKKVFR